MSLNFDTRLLSPRPSPSPSPGLGLCRRPSLSPSPGPSHRRNLGVGLSRSLSLSPSVIFGFSRRLPVLSLFLNPVVAQVVVLAVVLVLFGVVLLV